MKRFNLTILIFMLLSIIANRALAYDAYVDGIYYDLHETHATVTFQFIDSNESAYSGNIVIPESITYNGKSYSVTSIRGYAFFLCSGLTSVTIPNTITSIGAQAFKYCTSLKSVDIPNSVTSIEEESFLGCSALSSVTVPNSITSVGSNAFWGTQWYNSQTDGLVYVGSVAYKYKGTMPANTTISIKEGTKAIADAAFFNCSGLTSITIPNTVTYIGLRAFKDCYYLSSINIPNSVSVIDAYSFQNCRSLTSITIPNSITSISDGVFYGCNGLVFVTIPNSVTNIGGSAFEDCSNLSTINIPNSVTIIGRNAFQNTDWFKSQPDGLVYVGLTAYKYKGKMPSNMSIDIKEGTISISDYAFSDCSGLFSVSIPNSVTSIGVNAFSGCSSLTTINIPDGITTISNSLFNGCSSLSSITLPNTLKSIGYSAFNGCLGLASIEIPSSVGTIGSGAFYGCSGLASCTITEGLETIEGDLFRDCTSLTSIVIPNSVKSISYSAFSDCTALTSVTLSNTLTSIGDAAFCNCYKLDNIEFPKSLTMIGDGAFGGTAWYDKQPNGLIYAGNVLYEYKGDMPANTEITLKNGTLCIASGAFRQGSVGLVSINIPNSVVAVGNHAFADCRELTSVTIPRNVKSIGMMAFYNCVNIQSVISEIDNPFGIDETIFSVMDESTYSDRFTSATLYVPIGTKEKYLRTAGWKKFQKIIEMEQSEITLDDGYDYGRESDLKVKTLNYSRTFRNTNWQAWYVPFDVQLTSDVLDQFSFAKFAGTYTEEDGSFYITVVRLKEGDVVKANTPYCVQAKVADDNTPQVITQTDVMLKAAMTNSFYVLSPEKKITFWGNYVRRDVTADDQNLYAMSGGLYSKQLPGNSLAPFRCFFTIEDREDNPYAMSSNPANVKLMVLGDDETGIEDMPTDNRSQRATEVYDLSGRRVSKQLMRKGVFISNGKKVIVR